MHLLMQSTRLCLWHPLLLLLNRIWRGLHATRPTVPGLHMHALCLWVCVAGSVAVRQTINTQKQKLTQSDHSG